MIEVIWTCDGCGQEMLRDKFVASSNMPKPSPMHVYGGYHYCDDCRSGIVFRIAKLKFKKKNV